MALLGKKNRQWKKIMRIHSIQNDENKGKFCSSMMNELEAAHILSGRSNLLIAAVLYSALRYFYSAAYLSHLNDIRKIMLRLICHIKK